MPAEPTRPYHHGDLRPALVRAAVEVIGESGPATMSLREVARRAGVSHAAAAYHFGDKAGLLTALAAQGYRMLTEELRSARDARSGLLEVGVAYVRFAVSHRAHFEVMYRPELYRRDDAEVREARAAAAVLLYGTASPDVGQLAAGAAAWSLVHGLATLWLNGNLPPQLGSDPEEITRLVTRYLSIPASPTRLRRAPQRLRGHLRPSGVGDTWFHCRTAPFPTLFRTLADLDRRWHPLVLIIVAGLSVLVVHLVAYPWP